ncbi:DgyrCDS209 [Dimorphilus gyrociliatus]|uniref:DNA-directed RNA polymerase n=1 Tax=Dimorphilus gyrociliatus TaxID=2664684 RepID=A0A7I8V6G9_9ANNE|nr:DgyrCDS209 [Dimorphilus gyrociliatus]
MRQLTFNADMEYLSIQPQSRRQLRQAVANYSQHAQVEETGDLKRITEEEELINISEYYESHVIHTSEKNHAKPKKNKAKQQIKRRKRSKPEIIFDENWISEFPAESTNFDRFREDDVEFHPTDLTTLLTSNSKTLKPLSKSDLNKEMTGLRSILEANEQLTSESVQQHLKLFKRLRSLSDVRKASIIDAVNREIERRKNSFNAELKAYIDVCISCGLTKKASFAVVGGEYARSKSKTHSLIQKQYHITDINVYETLLHALAKKRDTSHMKNVFQCLKSNKDIKTSLQCYAAYLECFGRMSINGSEEEQETLLDEIRQCLNDIQEQNFDLENILRDCTFQGEELDHILLAIRLVLPSFSPKFPEKSNDGLAYEPEILEGLALNKDIDNPHYGVLRKADLNTLISDQIKNELDSSVTVSSIQPQSEPDEIMIHARNLLEKSQKEWRKALKKSFKRLLKQLWEQHKGDFKPNLLPYFKLFPADVYVDYMMQEINLLSLFSGYSPALPSLQRSLGRKLYDKYQALKKTQNEVLNYMNQAYEIYSGKLCEEKLNSASLAQIWNESFDQACCNIPLRNINVKWPDSVTRQVGKLLYSIILADIHVDANMFREPSSRQEIPAFYSVQIQKPGEAYSKEEIRPHPTLLRLYERVNNRELIFNSRDMPTMIPPIPWTSLNNGISFLSTTELVKNAWSSPTHQELLQSTPTKAYQPVLDSLSSLSSTPWRINNTVLDIIIDLFNKGGDASLDLPPPSSSCPLPPEIPNKASPAEKNRILRERQKIQQQRHDMHGLWCTELYRLSIANKFRDKVFYFPHNLDFRGRAYAVPPHFNHLGNDLARSILLFAKGKELGEYGLDWLKIHLVNLTGLRKRSSNKERLQFADSIMEDILDSAHNPFKGKQWWTKSDEPWQTLACCIEIANAINSKNPKEYLSYFPVHQDGSCNGLQHYAALGRDQGGAESVNLAVSDRPKDVYSDVLDLVEEERKKDLKNGMEIAKLLEGFVSRKVIKQTVMTTVYGVTWYGAWNQIMRQLDDLSDFPQSHSKSASQYLATKTLLCIQKMFSATKRIQDWLTLSADIISVIANKPVEWQTPLGWPVVQPYMKPSTMPSSLLEKHAKGLRLNNLEKPDARKQKNGYPPNFIHSLDSTHMMLTALQCFRAGRTFVSVHDCYWTHAADVSVMNKICRQEFVRLHKYPILHNLSEQMTTKSSVVGFNVNQREIFDDVMKAVLKDVPEKGDFNLDKVLESEFFFS